MRQLPAELSFDQLYRYRCGWCPGSEEPNTARRIGPEFFWRVRYADEHCRSGAKHRDVLVLDKLEDLPWFDAPQAYICHAAGRVDPGERPSVRVEHRQGPEVPVSRREVVVDERSHDIQVRVTVGDHHPFWARRRSARVIDGEEIGLSDINFVVIGGMRL